jgi:26S proteasome regulatory subunit N11
MLLLLLLHTATISNSIVIDYRKNELEEQMLMNLHRKQWTEGLVMKRFEDHQTSNEKTIEVQLVIHTV